MAGYRLRVTYAGQTSVEELEHLDDLADRVAFERLAHELNPVTPVGYTVAFRVHTAGTARPAADGHFYVRAADMVAAPVETRNSRS